MSVEGIQTISPSDLNGTQSAPKTEAPKVETPAPAATETPKPEESVSKGFSVLAKKSKAIQLEKQRMAQERSQWLKEKAKYDELQPKIQEFTNIQQWAKNNPLKALELLGLNYDGVTSAVLGNQSITPEQKIQQVEGRVEEWIRAQEAQKVKEAEARARMAVQREQRQVHQVIEGFKGELSEFVAGKTDEYELINLNDPSEMTSFMLSTAQEFFARTKKVPSIKELADWTEKWLEDENTEKLLKSKKLQSKLAPPKEERAQPQPRMSATLSNNLTASSSAPSMLPAKTENDRLARAMAALDGKK